LHFKPNLSQLAQRQLILALESALKIMSGSGECQTKNKNDHDDTKEDKPIKTLDEGNVVGDIFIYIHQYLTLS
jgi:hypothetical protein